MYKLYCYNNQYREAVHDCTVLSKYLVQSRSEPEDQRDCAGKFLVKATIWLTNLLHPAVRPPVSSCTGFAATWLCGDSAVRLCGDQVVRQILSCAATRLSSGVNDDVAETRKTRLMTMGQTKLENKYVENAAQAKQTRRVRALNAQGAAPDHCDQVAIIRVE